LRHNLEVGIYEFSNLQRYFLSAGYKLADSEKFALASYNWGMGNVLKTIQRYSSGEKTFAKIQPHLPKETVRYINNILRDRNLIRKHDLA